MNIYLAARYGRHPEMQIYRERLQIRGYKVTSRWINGEHNAIDGTHDIKQRRIFALDDVEDLYAAETFMSFGEVPRSNSRGGRHVE